MKLIELFLGNCVSASEGEWVALPMSADELKLRITEISKKYGEIIISSYNKLSDKVKDLYIGEYTNIYEINQIVSRDDKSLALYIYSDENMEFVERILQTKKFLFIEGASNLEELGEKVVEKGLVGYVPQNLIDNGYIDYEQIGTDFECNGLRCISGLGYIGQVSDRNHKKWQKVCG